MIFYGQPNMMVTTRQTNKITNVIINKPLFRFNDKGEYETNDEIMIKRLSGRFDCLNKVQVTEEKPKRNFDEILEKLKAKENDSENESNLVQVAEIKKAEKTVENMDIKEIRELGKKLKITSFHNMNIEKLKKKILEKQIELSLKGKGGV